MGFQLELTIQSILDQNLNNLEIIVIDDGSTDDTLERLKKFGEHVVIVHQENLGLSAARNAGIRIATGEYLNFLDADDRLLPGKLECHAAFMKSHPEFGAVFSDGFLVNPDGKRLNTISAESPAGLFASQSTQELRHRLYQGHPFPPHAPMIRRSAVLEIGMFKENMRAREDLDFWLRLSERFNICFLPGYLVEYCIREDSLSRNSKIMFTYSIEIYDQIFNHSEFKALSRQEQASHMRAWVVEVGVMHDGPWSRQNPRASFYAREALRRDPWNWRSWVLLGVLALPWMVSLARIAIYQMTRRCRRNFSAREDFFPTQ